MEMRQVGYFRTLAEELNFTRAAKRCGVSQPSLTRSIRLLEEEFGGQLFHREGVNTRLSELGQIVKPHLDEVFNQAQSAAVQALNFKANLTIRLKLGVMCTIAPTDLIQLLTGVRVRHPDIQIDVADADTEMLYGRLREGELEAALVGRPENEQPKPGFHYLPLYREQFVVVTGPDHRLSALGSVRCADLHDEAYLRRVNCELADLAGRVFRENGISTRTVYRSDRDDWILGNDGGRVRVFVHAKSLSKPLASDRGTFDRAGVLAGSQLGNRSRPTAFTCCRRARSRSHAHHMDGRPRAGGKADRNGECEHRLSYQHRGLSSRSRWSSLGPFLETVDQTYSL